MSAARVAAVVVGGLRVVYDVALLIAPKRVGKPWIGDASATQIGQLTLRSIAIRDLAINTGIVVAAITNAPVRPWLAASAVADLVDVGVTFAAASELPPEVPKKAAAVAGFSAALSVAVFAWVDS